LYEHQHIGASFKHKQGMVGQYKDSIQSTSTRQCKTVHKAKSNIS